ncbi:uncharacterized protein BYT42DRAFT_499220 [Radiomyces spectabilis]|uniref:uncharacterized protein n=1 Tax=Radiomyces spectabilis TaxID=64574 RepID=UPI002220BC9E|nr:uncharacterized protein BYT42DRAFT_499220 [Radiomyces spectabilis]KAI8374270.1 hypothetical protein BYT42DRAFT_499220 [Radiomyces spectabilis]
MPQDLEPCLARLGVTPEDKPSFVKEINAIDDVETLRQLVIRKERERQSIANDLDVAARLGLVISETNEAIHIKLAHLERENQMLRDDLQLHTSCRCQDADKMSRFHDDLNTALPTPSSDEDHIQLTQELDQARRELTKFRKEMDGLSAQLNDMASEMVDSRARVSMYAKRLAEVEHKLATTREMNTNLQLLLERALTNQKQSSSNTSHLVKNIQTDLSRIVAENDQLRARIAELEHQQLECEERLTAMVAQAKEYASLLEQAQDIIHNLSEPRLSDDDSLSNGLSTASSAWDNSVASKDTEITKGAVFSAEFRHEMQKEIERNLTLRNEIRHRIITAESITADRKKSQEGLKYLLSDYDNGSVSLSTSTSSSTVSTLFSSSKKDRVANDTDYGSVTSVATSQTGPSTSVPINTLRPANFLTGFNSFSSDGLGMGTMPATSFITRGIPPRAAPDMNDKDSESSEDEWIISSTATESDIPKLKARTKPKLSAAAIRTVRAALPRSALLTAKATTSKPLPPSPVPSTAAVDANYLSNEELAEICKTMDAQRLVTRLVDVYKNSETYLCIREIETPPFYIEARMVNQLDECGDPCSFIVQFLQRLALHFAHHTDNKDFSAKFRRLLAQALLNALDRFLTMAPSKLKQHRSQQEEPDLISFQDTPKEEEEENDEKMDEGANDDDDSSDEENHDHDDNEVDEDESMPIISLAQLIDVSPEVTIKYTLSRKHQEACIGLLYSIPTPILVYYALNVFQLVPLLSEGGEFQDDGVRLCQQLIHHANYNEAVLCMQKLNLYNQFKIETLAEQFFMYGQGAMLALYVGPRPDLQRKLLHFIDTQLRYNFTGSLEIISEDILKSTEPEEDMMLPLQRLKDRRFQKEMINCGKRLVQDMQLPERESYFLWLSQRYGSLRWLVAQRAKQQMDENDYSIAGSSNFNGLIELVASEDPALAKLAIKELIDVGDNIAPAFFAAKLHQQHFFCRYQTLPLQDRLVGSIKGEQLSRHRSSFSPSKHSDSGSPTPVIYYTMPPHVQVIFVETYESLMHMDEILRQSHLIGLDTEWVPQFARNRPIKTALMQIASHNGYAFLLDLTIMHHSWNAPLWLMTKDILQRLFENSDIIKLAYDFDGDFATLAVSIPSLKDWKVAGLHDFKTLRSYPPGCKDPQGLPIAGGLGGVVSTFLNVKMNKKQQLSNWEQRPLSEEQIQYAGKEKKD